MSHPVIYQPSGEVIGQADTRRGAIGHASGRISKLACEQWSATLAETRDRDDLPDFSKAWFVSPILRRTR